MRALYKTKGILTATVIAAALVTVACHAYAAGEGEGPVNFTGRIVKIEGSVQVRPEGALLWEDAEHGTEIGVKDTIKTGIDSKADIMFTRNGTRSKIRVMPESEMNMMTLDLDKVTGDSQILLDLAVGHIIVKTDSLKGGSKFEVLTPTSMTAVRGTGFEVIVKSKEEE
jgi:Uncharacterized protein conserved in bacteria